MLDEGQKSVTLILLGLAMLAGLLGCSESSSNAPTETDSSPNAVDESDRIVGEVGPNAARCQALSIECGYGYDYQANKTVDLWELSTDGSYWLFKEEYANGGARCEALTESCGWRYFPNTDTYIDVWVFDYGSMEFIENPDLSSIPKGLQPGDPPVTQPGREQENDRVIVGEADESTARCKAINTECGFGYDFQNNVIVDLWELSADGSYWLLKEEFENVGVRCEALMESCGWRWFPNTETYIDVWVFDYGSMEFIENPDLPYIPKGLQPGDPPVTQPGRES